MKGWCNVTSVIARRSIKNCINNPIYYVGAVLVFIGIFLNVLPYLDISYYSEGDNFPETLTDEVDIMDGYIPVTLSEQYDMGLSAVYNNLIYVFGLTGDEADNVLKEIKSQEMSIAEISEFLEVEYSYVGAEMLFYGIQTKQGTAEEINTYIEASLSKENYTAYFGRKVIDYMSVFIIFYAIILLPFMYISDAQKDVYELLHTKPLTARQYIIGKVMGVFFPLLLVVAVLTAVFTVFAIYNGLKAGFPVSIFDIAVMVLLYIVPNLFMIIGIYTLVTVLFKTPLPAAPALLLYAIYSNMIGMKYVGGVLTYKTPILAALIRFPDLFFGTGISAQAVINQCVLTLGALVMLFISIYVWKRRRSY